jgi:Resolvase, N terminal domain
MTSELVTARHLGRKAVIYIRQSTPQQVLSNQESPRLQYALRQRARELGWCEADIEIIDSDLGRSGTTATQREGFKDLIARVTLGEVGIIFSYEVKGWRGTARIGTRCSTCVVIANASSAAATACTTRARPTGGFFSV